MRLHAALLFALAALPSLACKCAPTKPLCNSRPNLADPELAIFVGTVRSVYPAESMQDYLNALVPPPPKPAAFNPGIEEYRDGLLRIWRGVLTAEEERKIRNATSMQDLDTPFQGMYWNLPRRVQLTITEKFSGPAGDNFELFTGIGGGDCGVQFKAGESYLVVASRNPDTRRWTTTICAGTKSSLYASKDLSALRSWKKGATPERSVYGVIQDWTDRSDGKRFEFRVFPNLRLRLTAGDEEKVVVTGAEGDFDFTGLAPKIYHLDADLPGWRFGELSVPKQTVDLTKANCADLFLYMRELQGEFRGKLRPAAEKPVEGEWIEAIPVSAKGRQPKTGTAQADGSFVISELEPGDYRIAINVADPPTTKNGRSSAYDRITPYPPTFFPGTPDPARAQVFHVERGQTIKLPPWNLPPPDAERAINGVVLWPNRKPAPTAHVVLTVESTGVDALRAQQIAPNGGFTVYGLENLPYRLRAAAYDPAAKLYYKGSAAAPPGATGVTIVLEADGEKPSDNSLISPPPSEPQ